MAWMTDAFLPEQCRGGIGSNGGDVRVGIIVPATNTTVEDDFSLLLPQLLPHRIRFHYARAEYGGVLQPTALKDMKRNALKEAAKLAKAGIDMLAFACTSASFLEGPSSEEALRKHLEDAAGGVPVTTAASAAVSALRSIGAKSIAFISPYPKTIHRRGVDFFRDYGFLVPTDKCLGLKNTRQISSTSFRVVKQLVKETLIASVDAVFVSCTNFRVFRIIEEIEKEVKIAVVTSNQALLWSIVSALTPATRLAGLGQLFRGSET